MDRLDQQIAFLQEADKLKHINRATLLVDGSRHENSAEHSWHLALYALVLADQAGPEVDINRVLKMLILHDLVEIDAGDTPVHGSGADPAKQAALEQAAAARLFAILPPDIGAPLCALWQEFEAAQTPDAIFAKSLDRVQPMVHNLAIDGRLWRAQGVSRRGFLDRVGAPVKRGLPALWAKLWARAERYFT